MTDSPKTVRIDIVSDVVCPWCIVGYKQLEEALSRLEGVVEAEVHWHPFELNPMMPPEGQELREHMGEKYGSTHQQSDAARARLASIGDSLGFSFNFYEGQRIYNTFLAHQLLAWAGQEGKQSELELALFEAYFSREEHVGDIETLVTIGGRVGLGEEAARKVLEDGRYAHDVREQQRFWLSKGIHAVPSYVLDRRFLIPGAQDPDVFVQVLDRIANGEEA